MKQTADTATEPVRKKVISTTARFQQQKQNLAERLQLLFRNEKFEKLTACMGHIHALIG